MSVLHEIRLDRKTSFSWADFVASSDARALGVRDGLYAFFFVNELGETILDNNKSGGKPRKKVVIHKDGVSLKVGKFERGLLGRLKNYQKHLHWVALDHSEHFVFTSCLELGFILDLSDCKLGLPSTARVFERYWADSVYQFVAGQGLLAPGTVKQKLRAEWRYLDPVAWSNADQKRIANFLRILTKRILRMAAAATKRSGRSKVTKRKRSTQNEVS